MAQKKVYIDLNVVKSELEKLGVSNAEEEALVINSKVKTLLSSYKEKPSIAKEQYKSAKPFCEVYKSTKDLKLPQWVLRRIDEARVMGSSSQTIIFPEGTKYQINNPLNDLPATAWLNFTTSVFSTFYSTNGEDSYAHQFARSILPQSLHNS